MKNEVRDFLARLGVHFSPCTPSQTPQGLPHVTLPFPWGFASFPYLWLIYASCSLISDSTMPCSLSTLRQYLYKHFTQNLRNSLTALKLVTFVKACSYTCLNTKYFEVFLYVLFSYILLFWVFFGLLDDLIPIGILIFSIACWLIFLIINLTFLHVFRLLNFAFLVFWLI